MGSPRHTFKKKLLAASVAALTSVSYSAIAQDAAPAVEEVLVTGIRASLENAMDIKRESSGVVDAISAEDIGKMPDANLAESLQRITGLSISRTNGEGSRVTVRGIDPSLNMVTLNGRNMPAVTNDGNIGDTASRAFDFANVASEVVNGVEVYKTGKADITSGGLGAVINIKSVRPLEAGNKATIGVKAVNDTTADRGDGAAITPEVSGLYSWASDSGVFGVSLAAAYQVRENSRSNVFVNNWTPHNDITDTNIPTTATIINRPAGLFNMPSDLRYAAEDNTRTRTNSLLTLQYQPTESLTATLDYVYSNYELEADRSQQSTWYNYDKITHLEFDYNTVQAPLIYQEAYPGAGKDVSFAQELYNGTTESNSIGLNVAWDVSDRFTLEFDAHNSTAENLTDWEQAGLNANVTIANYADFSNDMPIMNVEIDDSFTNLGNNNGYLDGGDMSGAIGTVSRAEQETEITQVRLKGMFALTDDSNLAFGVESREDINSTVLGAGGTTGRITMGNWGGIDPDAFGEDWPAFFTARNFGDMFPDYPETTGDADFLSNGLDVDMGTVKTRMEEMLVIANTATKVPDPDDATKTIWVDTNGNPTQINPDNFNGFPDGKFQWNGINNLDRTITEEVTSIYLQYDSKFELDTMPAGLVVGVRYEQTDVTSIANVKLPVDLEWQSDNDWGQVLADEKTSLTETGSYSNLLPSIDFNLSPSDDVVVRASWSKTLGRAGYNDLRAGAAVNSPYSRTANIGDPNLKPMVSTNLDLSAEWYYDEGSYLSFGLFQKNVINFIGSAVIESEWYGLRDSRAGPRFEQAIADINAKRNAGDLNSYHAAAGAPGVLWDPASEEHQHDQMLLNEGLDPTNAATSIYNDPVDPLMVFQTNTPVNDREAKIHGYEVAVQHFFGDSGFGASANYTGVNTDVAFDITKTEGQFALVGLSDTANLAVFFDKYGIQARVNYNWRDEFLDNRNQSGNEPSFTEAYHQIDMSINYEITEQLSVGFEGLNLTGENSRRHGRSETQLWSLEDLGARYSLGARYTF